MQEAFIKLFSTGDTTQTIALVIILLLTFLLGMLVWALLAHFPASRALKNANKDLTADNNLLKKENKDLSERYTVVNAKFNRASEDLQTAQANLKEKNEKVKQQEGQIKKLRAELELHTENARNAKEAKEKLMEEFKKKANENEALQKTAQEQKELIEELKGIVEEVEGEKAKAIRDKAALTKTEAGHAQQLEEEQERLKAATEKIAFLRKDLEAALSQKAELKKRVVALEESEQLEGIDDDELRTQLVGLKSHVRDLESENSELMERLKPYLTKELEEQKREEEMDQLLVDLLVEAEDNMSKDGFYVDYDEDELIEDRRYLEKTLGEEAAQELPEGEEETPIELDADEEAAMDEAIAQAEVAMSMQGFYGDIEEAVLLEDQGEALSDDELLDKHMAAATEIFENALFFNEEASTEGFVEDEAHLEHQLSELKAVEHPEDAEEDAAIALNDEEHKSMDDALSMAVDAMNEEGLYAPIDSSKLMGGEDNEMDADGDGYKTELEVAVLQEIGRSIPKSDADNKDDLQRIDGIGLYMEQQLNRLGIYTFHQISQFDAVFIAKLGAALGFTEQTIARDRWVEQAKELV